MDKKNTLLGAIFIIGAFASLYFGQRLFPAPPAPPAEVRAAVARQNAEASSAPGAVPTAPTITGGGPQAAFAATTAEHAGASITKLENDVIAVRFTDFGGAISDVALKKYPAALGRPDPFVFNELHSDPILALTESSINLKQVEEQELLAHALFEEVAFSRTEENLVQYAEQFDRFSKTVKGIDVNAHKMRFNKLAAR